MEIAKNPRLVAFSGGDAGTWQVSKSFAVKGDPLSPVSFVSIHDCKTEAPASQVNWLLQGVVSNTRYVSKREKAELAPVEPPLGREQATLAAMIPLRKNADWWAMTQEERRDIFQRSAHHDFGLKALPAIARRLHHCRDLASAEPFDFITWFEFAPEAIDEFDKLLVTLRSTEEWQYIDREYEIRLKRAGAC